MNKSIPALASAIPALGPYSAAAEAGGFVFLSGQVAIDPSSGEHLSDRDVGAQTEQIMSNISAMIAELGLTMDDIVKTSIFLADIADYGVVNDVYGSYIGDHPPARSAFQVGALPGGFRVEIEVIASRS